ncbi:hypothetical protein, partial [Moritella viscosa]|uniref:hypothetical protein n=1 Tax=Moritella viscosa TaxID=80854 RepID=UPI001160D7ED
MKNEMSYYFNVSFQGVTVNILEADYGIGPLIDVEDTILAGIEKLFERNRQEPGFDGLWMNEYGEVLFGSLLVSVQAYCVGSLRVMVNSN